MSELISSNEFERAEALLRDASVGWGENVRLEWLGNLHFRKRDFQVAITFYEAAIVLDPGKNIPAYQYLVGYQNELEGNFVAAFERYQSAIETDPTFVDTYVELGALVAKADDYEGAAKCYRDALRLAPDDVQILYNLRTVLARLDRANPGSASPELTEISKRYDSLVEAAVVAPKPPDPW